MSRRYTRRGTALLLVLALLVSMLGAALPVMQKAGAASGAFATAYTALLEKAPVAQADLERDSYGCAAWWLPATAVRTTALWQRR